MKKQLNKISNKTLLENPIFKLPINPYSTSMIDFFHNEYIGLIYTHLETIFYYYHNYIIVDDFKKWLNY